MKLKLIVFCCLFILASGKVQKQAATNSWRDLIFGGKWLSPPRLRESKCWFIKFQNKISDTMNNFSLKVYKNIERENS